MSLYQLHRCVWDQMRADEGSAPAFDPGRYDLTDAERQAVETRDVVALYRLGVHPLLLNGFRRTTGMSPAAFRRALRPFAVPEPRSGRWRR